MAQFKQSLGWSWSSTAVLTEGINFPSGQLMQAVKREVSAYCPGPQMVQEIDPSVSEIFPFGHSLHWSAAVSPVSVENIPGAHFFSQSMSAVSPVSKEYLPAEHSLEQSSTETSPSVPEYLPAGHSLHAASDVCARASEYFPASHATQTATEV